jgi:hypothetical protein
MFIDLYNRHGFRIVESRRLGRKTTFWVESARSHVWYFTETEARRFVATCLRNQRQRLREHIGCYARSIESGWLGKIVGVDGDLLRMKGVNTLVHTIRGGDIEDCLDDDDTQWFDPHDLRFVKVVEGGDA